MVDPRSDYYQHGDVLLHSVDSIPAGAKKVSPNKGHHVLAEGEATGHAHVVQDLTHCDVFAAEDGTLYMSVQAPVEITHEEHRPLTIPIGTYRVGRVREVDPFNEAVRQVRD